VNRKDLADIKEQIDRVYSEADFVGSLVTEGETGRPTEYDGPKVQPPEWWEDFWTRHEKNTGDSREEALRKLEKLLGRSFRDAEVSDSYLTALLESAEPGTNASLKKKKKGLLEKLFGK
jgi:hypothetical protein